MHPLLSNSTVTCLFQGLTIFLWDSKQLPNWSMCLPFTYFQSNFYQMKIPLLKISSGFFLPIEWNFKLLCTIYKMSADYKVSLNLLTCVIPPSSVRSHQLPLQASLPLLHSACPQARQSEVLATSKHARPFCSLYSNSIPSFSPMSWSCQFKFSSFI